MDKWPPTEPPQVKEDFEQTADKKKTSLSQEHVKPATTEQLEELEKQRKALKAEIHLVPKGVQPPKSKEDQERERKIKDIRERLEKMRGRSRDDFNRTI